MIQLPPCNPRTLHRSKTFWIGLFILLFLAWAWWDSHQNFSAVIWHGQGLAYSGDGHLGYGYVSHISSVPIQIDGQRGPLSPNGLKSHFGGYKTISLPHWLIFESTLLLWFLLLAWRTRRHLRTKQALKCSGGL